ncbi:MAG: bifunctional hydroxymethylpyrimidine kinase/phosphomethylpyrimidine kinase [Planctomycetes bacterium]|nr:bifunctional hydroxymethylpyrimidine kinase/phosphomethylpyrimidine kinase [Planctomycetota bacterium]
MPSARRNIKYQIATALTIAGLDPTGGAGITADALRFAREGVHPLSVATAVTTQTTRGVSRAAPVPVVELRAQLRALFSDIHILSVKTGLIPSAAHVRAIVDAIPARVPIVVDPVVASSGGYAFVDAAGARAIGKLLIPRAALVTPNLDEAELLSGVCSHSREGAARAGKLILQMGAGAVLIKGGHGDGAFVEDLLVTRRGVRVFRSRRIAGSAHGTGCALSAVIAARLALGDDLETAIAKARSRVRADLRAAFALGRGRPTLGL